MNLLMLADVSSARVVGGAERVLQEHAREMNRRGHTVTVICRSPGAQEPASIDMPGWQEYRYAPLTSGSFSFVRSSVTASTSLMKQRAQRQRFDAVVIHQSLSGLGPIAFARRHGRRWIYVCHSLAHEEYLSRTPKATTARAALSRGTQALIRRIVERRVLAACDQVIVLSDFMRQRVMAVHGIPGCRIHVIAGGADIRRFTPADDREAIRQRLGIGEAGISLFTVRNLVERMGIENLIDAMALIAPRFPAAHLTIAGTGPLEGALRERIEYRGLSHCVHLAGFIDESTLVARYQASDLMVLPTVMLEGFGLVTVEAMACATPVLGTPAGATPEIINRLDPRLLTSGADADSIAERLSAVLPLIHSHPDEWRALREKCRRLTTERYNWQTHTDAVLRTIEPSGPNLSATA